MNVSCEALHCVDTIMLVLWLLDMRELDNMTSIEWIEYADKYAVRKG